MGVEGQQAEAKVWAPKMTAVGIVTGSSPMSAFKSSTNILGEHNSKLHEECAAAKRRVE